MGCLKKSAAQYPLSIIIECYGKMIKGRAKVFNKNSEVALRAKICNEEKQNEDANGLSKRRKWANVYRVYSACSSCRNDCL